MATRRMGRFLDLAVLRTDAPAAQRRQFVACGRKPQDVPKRALAFPVPSPNRGDRRARPRLARVAPPGLGKASVVVSPGPEKGKGVITDIDSKGTIGEAT